MRLSSLLHTLFVNASKSLDKRVHKALMLAAETLSKHKHLSIAGLGRQLPTPAKVKHNIKRIDRLFGNKKLQTNIANYYADIANHLIKPGSRPVIAIDWSGLTKCGEYYFLRASIPCKGRALPILDMTFKLCDYTAPKSHKVFLNTLSQIIPNDYCPFIVTDAGFRVPWFKQVASLGWDFVGRVRNLTQYKNSEINTWRPVKSLYDQASAKAKYLFEGLLAKSNPFSCHFYTVKRKKMNRIGKNLAGKMIQCSLSKKHERRGNEPWLLATSLPPEQYNAFKIVKMYKSRMQIEESIRDFKNVRNGFGLRHCRSKSIDRLNVALLIGALAMLTLWLIGVAVKMRHKHYEYQANTIRHRSVLSNIIIGWQALIREASCISYHELRVAKQLLNEEALAW